MLILALKHLNKPGTKKAIGMLSVLYLSPVV